MSRHATAEQLSSYLDEALEPPRLRLVESHLDECEECRERLEGLRRVVGELRRLERFTPPSTLGQQLQRRIALEQHRRGLMERVEGRLRRVSTQPSISVTFALVFAFAVIIYLFADLLDLAQRRSIPVIVPPRAEIQVPAGRVAAGTTFYLLGSGWRQEGLEMSDPDVILPAASPEAAVFLEQRPELRQLLAEGVPVLARFGEQAVLLEPPPIAEAAGPDP